jgi:two-component system LytT family response regulator
MSVPAQERGQVIRALVVDDEPLARSNVRLLLRVHPDIQVVGECASGAEAIQAIREKRPALLFLDVQMPECDGFDVLEMLGSDVSKAVIFLTAYDQYALRAFDSGALDYVLKPFDDARFHLAVERAKQRLSTEHSSPPLRDRLAVKSAGQIVFVQLSEIDWIEAADYYACLHVGSRTHLLRRALAELERDLPETAFCRIHRSTIVNLERVRALTTAENGEYQVVLADGKHLSLSRKYRKRLQDRLGVRGLSVL